jgi:peptide-N4-(N-acetyl-beta-glucosaminyl)asparagine amidase
MLIARAMGYEARMAHEWGDHVWVECFSVAQQRWIHCDSCEDRMDAPLLYESGWGKKISYVIAFSIEEVVDVTPRYTRKWAEVCTRRTEVPESWVKETIDQLTKMKHINLKPERRAILAVRKQVEEMEFAKAKNPEAVSTEVKPEENQGRTTGSTEWREARGELGDRERTEAAIREQNELKEKIKQDDANKK